MAFFKVEVISRFPSEFMIPCYLNIGMCTMKWKSTWYIRSLKQKPKYTFIWIVIQPSYNVILFLWLHSEKIISACSAGPFLSEMPFVKRNSKYVINSEMMHCNECQIARICLQASIPATNILYLELSWFWTNDRYLADNWHNYISDIWPSIMTNIWCAHCSW